MAILFAYGSLMGPEALGEALAGRVETLVFRPARLEGWRRVWNVYRPEWDGAVLNVEPNPGDAVVGVLVEGLSDEDFVPLDARGSTHLPRESIFAVPFEGEAVAAQIYRRRTGNHDGRPAGRYKSLVLQQAYRAGWEVYESFCQGSVDAAGEPLKFG